MEKKKKNDVVMVALTPSVVNGVPDLIAVIPKGHVESRKGDFIVDDESFRLINKQFLGRRLDLVIDYEHQTLHDVQAPAAGWITELINGEDAIMAKVNWTPKGAEYLKNKEYRYLSPVIITRKNDKKVIALHSAALTNTPAIDGMFPLVGCSLDADDYEDYEEKRAMELEKLIKLLGLPETATEDEVEAALQSAGRKLEEQETAANKDTVVANSTILTLLGLKADAKTDEVAAAIVKLQNGDSTLAAEVQALKAQLEGRAADEAVTAALKAGKITAAQKDWARSYTLKDPEGFAAFVDKAPAAVVMDNLTGADPKEKGGKDGMSGVDHAVLKNLGISEAEVKEYYKEEV